VDDNLHSKDYVEAMATLPDEPILDIRERLARIDKTQAEFGKLLAESAKVRQETKFAPYTLIFTGLGAGAALMAAGAGLAKLLIG
jgi:hypothetical protein